ncbi:MAG TPA: helix-turn-helix domain-containing protein [Polyangiaceae bacterium]|jgi:hypothetical protein
MRALARVLKPYLDELNARDTSAAELLDVCEHIPAPTKTLHRACRAGRIVGACKVGRRWLATREAIDAFLRTQGPRLAKPRDDGDELDEMRERIARGAR